MCRAGLGRLAAWHLTGGPVGPPARWAATSNVEGGSGTEEGSQRPSARKGGLFSDTIFAWAPRSWLPQCSWAVLSN